MKLAHISSRLLLVFALFVGVGPLYAQWIRIYGTDSVKTISMDFTLHGDVYEEVILAGKTGGAFICLSRSGATNYWVTGNIGLPGSLTSVAVTPGSLFAGTSTGGVFSCTSLALDTGYPNLIWEPVNSGLSNMNVTVLTYARTVKELLLAGTDSGVYFSTNLNSSSGISWSAINKGLTNKAIRSLAVSGTNIFAGTNGGGIFRSTDTGANWAAINTGLTNMNVYAIAVSGTNVLVPSANVFIGTNGGGVFRSTDTGASWAAVNIGLPNLNVHALVYSTNLFAGTDSGIFMSTNNGTSWTAVNTGLTNLRIRALSVFLSYLYVGADDGVWRRPLSEMVTSIADRSIAAPPYFRLLPTGDISLTLSTAARVTLTAYTLSGEKAAMLLDERLSAGSYERHIHASALPHGLYFYHIQAGGVTETGKILLAQ
jgi:hypothetical protein